MATITVQPSGGDFTTLAAALSDAGTVANDIIEISGDWSTRDTAAATVADDNITIRTASGDQARHAGFDNGGSNYFLEVTTGHALTVNNTGCTVQHVGIKQDGSVSSAEGLRVAAAVFTVENTIIWADSADTDQDGIYFGNIDCTINVTQCKIFGFWRAGIHGQNTSGDADYTINVNSCSIWDNGHSTSGAATSSGGGVKTVNTGASSTKIINIYNTWSLENDTGSGTNADYIEGLNGGGSATWNISRSADSDNSIAGILDTGSNNLASRTLRDATAGGDEILVQDITTAPFDLRLIDDTTNNDAQDVHATATAHGLTIPATDIAGTSRPQNTNYDLGAFEVVVSAGETVSPGVGEIVLDGAAPDVDVGIGIGAGEIVIEGSAPVITTGAIPLIESTTVTESANAVTITVDMPECRPDGDLYVAWVARRSALAWQSIPANWNVLRNPSGTNIRGLLAWWIGDEEPASYAPGGSAIHYSIVYRISGYDPATPIDAHDSVFGNQTSPVDVPSVNTTVDETLVLRSLAAVMSSDNFTGTPEVQDFIGQDAGDDFGYGSSHENGPNPAGATGTAAFTHTAGNAATVGITCAIRTGDGGGGSICVPIPVGEIVIEGAAPSLGAISNAVLPGVGEIVIEGVGPDIVATLDTLAGEIVIEGAAPDITVTLDIPAGEIIIEGAAPDTIPGASQIVFPGVGEIVIEGFAPGVLGGLDLEVTPAQQWYIKRSPLPGTPAWPPFVRGAPAGPARIIGDGAIQPRSAPETDDAPPDAGDREPTAVIRRPAAPPSARRLRDALRETVGRQVVRDALLRDAAQLSRPIIVPPRAEDLVPEPPPPDPITDEEIMMILALVG